MSGNRKESTSSRPVVEEPPYLAVGTEVSAKYRGAFCEANIKSVKKLVKCKVNFENGGGCSTVTDDCISGELKVGSDVKVKVPDGEDMFGTLTKITDSSSYTVVFDDGDERTLKRTYLCIKGEKHFNESETLDHLPLTDPENFGTPVVQQGKKSRKGRRNSMSLDESKDDEDIPARKKLNVKNDDDVDKVVMIDFTEKKKSFLLPALLLASPTLHWDVKSPENVLVRSFKDGKHIEVHPKDVKEFSKENVVNSTLIRGENSSLKSAVEHAVKYLETKQLPSNWSDDQESEVLKNETSDHSSSSEAESDGDENEKSEFLEKLTKFLGEKGTPLLRSPVLGHRDLDLYKLFKIVSKMNGFDKVECWSTVYKKMNIQKTTTACYHIKNAYKRYLYDYEVHVRQESENSATKKGKSAKKGAEKSSDHTAENCNQNEGTTDGSDFEKNLKELPLSSDNKLSTQIKPVSKKVRSRRKARSLRSPGSPALSPMSPCSPKSVGSVSASESTDCPSPADNYCDVRELRGKIDLVLEKFSEKTRAKGDDIKDSNGDMPDKCKENDSKDCSKAKKKKVKACKESELVVKLEKTVASQGTGSKSDAESENGTKGVAESSCKDDAFLKNGDEKQECKDLEKEENSKKDCVGDGKDPKKSNRVVGSPLDEGGGEDQGDCGEKTDMGTPVDNQGQDGTDIEDAVDVVNSPSSTSVDSDDRGERKTDRKSKKKGEGKAEAKNTDASDDADELKYKLNDRIDVRYGRGRNATIYHAKITSVDQYAEEGLYYLVHYQGWNARHDEWIGHERIIGRGTKQSRTRSTKEPTKNVKPAPKPTAKPVAKPVAKKNGKNGGGHAGRASGGKTRRRTPSPTVNMVASGRNGNGRTCKNRKDTTNDKTDSPAEVKFPARITRKNSLTSPVEMSEEDFVDEQSPETRSESDKDVVSSPARIQRSSKSPSPKRLAEKEPTEGKNEKLEDGKVGKSFEMQKSEKAVDDETSTESGGPSEMDVDNQMDGNNQMEMEKNAKRPREDETETSSADSPPAKKKASDKESSSEDVFEETTAESPGKKTNDVQVEPSVEDTNGPDLTCSEQLPTNCASPDPYTSEFAEDGRFFGNDVKSTETSNGSKEKDSSSSLDEGKVEKVTASRRAKYRRDRKARSHSTQSSVDGSDCHNSTLNGPAVTVMLSPSWTPKYNFTEDLDELLKNEESSERIRLLTERIKDIRKAYGELKSEVANIDRKRKRRQKRKREEELSTEESATRSPSRSSPLTGNTAVSSANAIAAVECR